MHHQLKHNLLIAQQQMKKYADMNRTDRKFKEGEMVYLKMQPYRLAAFDIRTGIKLATKFYGPFRILEKISHSAYKLLLHAGVQIHNVFHVSQLKRHLGPKAIPAPSLPLVDEAGKIKIAPVLVLQTRAVP